MSIFKKKCSCGCCDNEKTEENHASDSELKILGGGCAKCNQLEENTIEALKQLNLDIQIDHVKDYAQIASYGVMSTPALVYKGKVLSFGKVLKTEEIVDLLQKELI